MQYKSQDYIMISRVPIYKKKLKSIFLRGTVTVLQLHSHLKYLIVRFQNKLVTLSMNADLLDVHLASCHPNVIKSVTTG